MFRRVFNHVPEGREVGEKQLSLSQGRQSMVEFTLCFHTLAVESEWNELSLKAAFRRGLTAISLLACWYDEATLDSLIDMSIKIDSLLPDISTLNIGSLPRY